MLTAFYFLLRDLQPLGFKKRETYCCEAQHHCQFISELTSVLFYDSIFHIHHWIIKIRWIPLEFINMLYLKNTDFSFWFYRYKVRIYWLWRQDEVEWDNPSSHNAGFVGRRVKLSRYHILLNFIIPVHWSLLLFSFSVFSSFYSLLF